MSLRNRNLFEDLKVTETPKQLTTPKFAVNYWNEDGSFKSTDYVMAMPFMGKDGQPSLRDLITVQEELLRFAVFETAAIGSLVCDPAALGLLNKLAKMLVVVGRSERGIDLANLLNAGDYLQIGRIFLSEAYTEDTIVPDNYKPSLIAKIHRMDFVGKLMEFNRQAQEKAMSNALETIAEPPTALLEIETPVISTPPAVVVTSKSI
jgi:hypothetical protein